MHNIRTIFNEAAALAAGFHGAIAGANIGFGGSATVLMAAGIGTVGVVPFALSVAAVGGMAALGAVIGYKGVKALFARSADSPPPTRRMNDPEEVERLPYFRRVAAKSYLWPHVKF